MLKVGFVLFCIDRIDNYKVRSVDVKKPRTGSMAKRYDVK